MNGTHLTEFEEAVLSAVGRLQDDAYGVSVRLEIESQTKRNVTIGPVHTALHQLEEKGLLKSRFGEATEARGSKRKRIFTLTPFGLKALRETQSLRSPAWTQLTQEDTSSQIKILLQ